jgi:hypothetical protein
MERRGDWMQTASGGRFWPLDPRPDEVRIEDIAHALSMQCRFAGHCRAFYSVAEHSVRVARHVEARKAPPRVVLAALLHDAAEAYVSDVVRPLKRFLPEHSRAEGLVFGAIAEAFNIPSELPWSVHDADETLLATEARDLMGADPDEWNLVRDPLRWTIEPWAPAMARAEFLAMFESLQAARELPEKEGAE